MKDDLKDPKIVFGKARRKFSNFREKPKHTTAKKAKKSIQKPEEETKLSPQDCKKFQQYMNKRRRKFLKQKLNDYYGKNFPINYRQDYDFDEQWKNNITMQEQNSQIESNYQNCLEITLAVLTIITFAVVIWINSIIHFFETKEEDFFSRKEIYVVGLALEAINAALKLRKKTTKYEVEDKLKITLRKIGMQFLTIPYFLTRYFIDQRHQSSFWIAFEGVVLILLYMEASKRYYRIRLMSFCLQHEYQTKLFDMLITIFIIAHFIALVLYSATKFDPQHSWITALNIDKQDALAAYNYSFYFTVTTIMTVGYGDITPKNRAEITIVSFVEIFGIIMFGYMINQIGYCISSLRKSRESIDKDLFVVEKLRQHYHMNEDLTNKVSSYLVDAKPKMDQVLPEEEQGILMKLNEEIREDMQRQNMASVVRSSIFFVCRWTRNFQEAISRNLIHIMANPNDVLYEPSGRERIYIVRSGKVHVYAERTGSKKGMNTPLKSIQSNIKKDIYDNCYGYSAVLSNRPTKLYAIAKDFTSCYYIEKAAFLQSVEEKAADFEYYHEIKSKIDQSKCCESPQVPRLDSSKHHYSPSSIFLIKKHLSDKAGNNKRAPYLRRNRPSLRGCKPYQSEKLVKNLSEKYIDSLQTSLKVSTDQLVSSKTETHPIASMMNSGEILAKFIIERDISDNLHHYFESSKEYSNYFVKHNKQAVLRKYDNNFFFPRNEEELKVNFTLQMYKEIAAATAQTNSA